jgi:hypothetical protein
VSEILYKDYANNRGYRRSANDLVFKYREADGEMLDLQNTKS